MILKRGVYTIEVSKKGYRTKRFNLTLEENTIKTIELEKKNKDIIYQDFNLTKQYTWKEAREYCQNLVKDGYSNWRFPNTNEILNSNLMYFKTRENRSIIFWTSDCHKSRNTCNRVHNFDRGFKEANRYDNYFDCPLYHHHSVICVREN